MKNHLHILTLTWNKADYINNLYQSLYPSLTNLNYTWHIKDNNSADNTQQVISNWKGNINLTAYPNNSQNFSEGCNFLFNQTSAKDDDYIMLLNNDVVFNDTTSLKSMIDLMEKDDKIGVVGARLLYNNSNKIQHAGVVFNPTYKTPTHFRTGEISDAQATKNRYFQAVTGAVLLTKAKYYKEIYTNPNKEKGMDTSFRWAFDDVDLCLSIKYHQNKKIVYCGNTNIYHEESASLKKNPVNKLYLMANITRFQQKWKKYVALDQEVYTTNKNYNLY